MRRSFPRKQQREAREVLARVDTTVVLLALGSEKCAVSFFGPTSKDRTLAGSRVHDSTSALSCINAMRVCKVTAAQYESNPFTVNIHNSGLVLVTSWSKELILIKVLGG